jgi:hypothetical protein
MIIELLFEQMNKPSLCHGLCKTQGRTGTTR